MINIVVSMKYGLMQCSLIRLKRCVTKVSGGIVVKDGVGVEGDGGGRRKEGVGEEGRERDVWCFSDNGGNWFFPATMAAGGRWQRLRGWEARRSGDRE
ncbi:hypothetical protein AgCh_027224 [Apium graveolens]